MYLNFSCLFQMPSPEDFILYIINPHNIIFATSLNPMQIPNVSQYAVYNQYINYMCTHIANSSN